MIIKVGDIVKGYCNSRAGFGDDHLGNPCFTGEVERINTDTLHITTIGGSHRIVFKDTAELLSTPLPLPAPIDWSRPVRTKDGRPARVLCINAAGSWCVIALVDQFIGGTNIRNTPQKACYFNILGHSFVGDGQCREANYLENVPVPKIVRKAWVYLHRARRGVNSIHLAIHEEGWTPRENEILAKCEVELVEGEGMN